MANMSHCRFVNTVEDLQDCLDNMYETQGLSAHEAKARLHLINLCLEVALNYGHEIGYEVEASK